MAVRLVPLMDSMAAEVMQLGELGEDSLPTALEGLSQLLEKWPDGCARPMSIRLYLACSPKVDPDAMRDRRRASAAELST